MADYKNSTALKEADLQKALEHTTVLTAELKQATLYQEQLTEEIDKLKDQVQASASTQSRETLEAATLAEELKEELKREQEKTATLQADTSSERAELEKEIQAVKYEVQCLKQQLQTKDKESLEEGRERHTVDTNEHKQLAQLYETQGTTSKNRKTFRGEILSRKRI